MQCRRDVLRASAETARAECRHGGRRGGAPLQDVHAARVQRRPQRVQPHRRAEEDDGERVHGVDLPHVGDKLDSAGVLHRATSHNDRLRGTPE